MVFKRIARLIGLGKVPNKLTLGDTEHEFEEHVLKELNSIEQVINASNQYSNEFSKNSVNIIAMIERLKQELGSLHTLTTDIDALVTAYDQHVMQMQGAQNGKFSDKVTAIQNGNSMPEELNRLMREMAKYQTIENNIKKGLAYVEQVVNTYRNQAKQKLEAFDKIVSWTGESNEMIKKLDAQIAQHYSK